MITVRPIRSSDLEMERAFIGGLSSLSSYRRLMSSRQPSDEELRRWTDVDGVREYALVAVVSNDKSEEQVGVARYVVAAGTTEAEFAIVLSDRWQNQGLGRRLLGDLVDAARRQGLTRLFGTTLAHNKAMLQLARKLGFELKRVPDDSTVTEMTLRLQGASASK